MQPLDDITGHLSVLLESEIERALRLAIANREGGDHYWNKTFIAAYGRCFIPQHGPVIREYHWRGVPILRVERMEDPLKFGYTITELQPK